MEEYNQKLSNNRNENEEPISKKDELKTLEQNKENIEGLSLGVIWERSNDSGGTNRDCFILTENDSKISIPNMQNGKEERKDHCKRLGVRDWSKDKKFSNSWKEAFWVGGDKKQVEEVIKTNLSGILKEAGFAKDENSEKNPALLYFGDLLNNSCSDETLISDDSIVGVTCIKKDNLDSFPEEDISSEN